MLDTTFVAAVLEGVEGTLADLIERVKGRTLCGPLVALQGEIAAVRRSFEDIAAAPDDTSIREVQ